MSASIRRFVVDESGASMIETLVVLNILVFLLIGFVEFSVAMNQWNLAAKATQIGARLAAVSDPVDSSLSSWTGLGPTAGSPPAPSAPFPGDPVDPTQDNYQIVCGTTPPGPPECNLVSGNYSAVALIDYDEDAMGWLVDGSDYDPANPTQRHCDASAPPGRRLVIGMCDVLPLISAENVNIRYEFTGLGYAGRPAGPIPTITVSLTGIPFDFPIFGRLLGLNNFEIPAVATTIVGEDISTPFP